MQHFTVTGCDVELAIKQGVADPAVQELGVISFDPPVIQILIRPLCRDLSVQQFEICGRLLPLGPGQKKPMPAGGALALEDVLRMLKNGYPRTTATMGDLYSAYSLGKEVAEEEVMRLREENTTLKAQLLAGAPGTPVDVPVPVIVGLADPPTRAQIKGDFARQWGEEALDRSIAQPPANPSAVRAMFPEGEMPMVCPPPAKE